MERWDLYRTVLFDLDGTLSDSQEGIVACLRDSLARMGIEETDTEKLRRCIGPSLTETYRVLYGMSDGEAARALEFYRACFERQGVERTALFDGAKALLDALWRQGKTLALATAKPTLHAERILEQNGIARYFALVAGSNLDGTREEKREVIAYALAALPEAARESAVMVGDRRHDIEGARENALPSIGVAYGYGGYEELAAAGADQIVCSVSELRAALLGEPQASPAAVKSVIEE